MQTKFLIVGLVTLFAASSVEAVAFRKPTATPGFESGVELAAGKKKTKKKVAKAKKSKGAKVTAATKSCGTFMYHKDGKCVDARAKK